MSNIEQAKTPEDLELYAMSLPKVVGVHTIEVFDQSVAMLIVCIRLNWWASFRCVFSHRYRIRVWIDYTNMVRAKAPDLIETKTILEL